MLKCPGGGFGFTVGVWEFGSRECTSVFHEHRASVSSLGATGDVKSIVSGLHAATVRVWDVGNGECKSVHTVNTRVCGDISRSDGDGDVIVTGA